MNPKHLLSFVLLAGAATAKTVFTEVAVKGVDQGYKVGVRVPTSNSAITDIDSNDIICNANPITPVSQTVIPVVAGDQVTAHFHRSSAGFTGSGSSEPLDPTNKGPILAYLAVVPSATQSTVTGLKWFKIWESTYDTTTHQWGSDKLYVAKGNATFNIPSCIAPGQYLLRVEALNLLHATEYPGAEFYMSCAQLQVRGSGVAIKAPETVAFPGAYRPDDAGITTTIFGGGDYYVGPGPSVFSC